jgi:hypothetical protein
MRKNGRQKTFVEKIDEVLDRMQSPGQKQAAKAAPSGKKKKRKLGAS